MRRFSVFLVFFLLLGLASSKSAAANAVPRQVLFQMKDPRGDDRGPGTYVYPKGPVFDPRHGLYDLTAFRVEVDDSSYYFYFTFAEKLSNPWGAPEGFSHQRIALYIDSQPNQGRSETWREGAYVDFDPRHGWEYFIDVTGWHKGAVYYWNQRKTEPGRRQGLMFRRAADGKTVEAVIPREALDEHPETWYYYVLIGSQDPIGPDGWRPVLAKATEWQFGGGTDTNLDPNVLDVLAPATGENSQSSQLGSYSVEKQLLAVVKPVHPEQPVSIKKYTWFDRLVLAVREKGNAILKKYPWNIYFPVYVAAILAFLILLLLIGFNLANWRRRRK
ncbi:MAG: glucodextranase DOMON-like domain-containing protein [Bacillota bacterium]